MANSERIDEIISEEAFQQLDTLLFKLGESQKKFADLAKGVAQTNNEINKTQSIKEFNQAINEANKGFEKLEAEQVKVIKARKDANKAESDAIQTTKAKLTVDQGAKDILTEYSGTYDQLIKIQLELKKTIKDLTAEQKALDKSFDTGAISSEEYEQRAGDIAVALAEGRQAVTDFNLEIRRSLKENNAIEGSYDAVSARLDRLRGLYRRLSEEERNSTEVGGALLKSIQETDKELKEIDKSLGITNRSVGNYKEAVQEALNETGLFSSQMAFLQKAKKAYAQGAKLATISTQSFGKALIATGIGAVLVLLGSLIAFLSKTQAGLDLVAKATAGVSTFVGVFIDALSTLGEQIVNNIIPVFGGLKDVVFGLLTLDFDQFNKGLADVKSGLDNIDPINLVEVAKQAGRASVEAVRLKGELQELEKAQSRLDVVRSQSIEQQEALRELSQDESKSLKERSEASEKLFQIENDLEQRSIELLEKRLAITKEQNSLTKSTEADLQRERDVEIEIANTRAQASQRRRRFEKEAETLRKKAQDDFKAQIKEREDEEKKLNDAVFNLEKNRLDRSINRNKEVFEDEKLSYSDRIDNLDQFIKNSEELINLEKEKQLSVTGLLKEDRIRIEEQAQFELEELRKQGIENSEKILLDQLSSEEQARSEANKSAIILIKKFQAEQITALNEELGKGLITEEEYQRKRLEIVEAGTEAIINEEIRQVEAIIEANKLKGITVAEEELKLAELRQRLSEETTKKTLENLNKVAEREKEVKNLQRDLEKELAELTITLINNRFEKQIQELQAKQIEIDSQREKEIESINASALSEEEKQLRIVNAERKAQLQKEEIETKRRKIDIERAKFEKASAILGIKVDTARAIVAQLPALPFSLPLIKLIGAIGLVQLTKAVATPIPAFAKGTKYSPEGLAIVGEEGTELIKDPQGNISLTGDSAELTYLQKGSEVVPHKEVVNMMQNGAGVWDAMIAENRRGTEEIKKAIKKRPEKSLNITKNGIFYLYKNGSKTDRYVNKLM